VFGKILTKVPVISLNYISPLAFPMEKSRTPCEAGTEVFHVI